MKKNKQIDVTKITEKMTEDLRIGLRSGKYTIDDIEKVLVDGYEEMKAKVLSDVEKMIPQEIIKDNEDRCPDCKKELKKTKNLMKK